jgi:hypothetical protein
MVEAPARVADIIDDAMLATAPARLRSVSR